MLSTTLEPEDFNSSSLAIQLMPAQGDESPRSNFTWEAKDFDEEKLILLINFDQPLRVSPLIE